MSMRRITNGIRSGSLHCLLVAGVLAAASCSPGTLPGAPSPQLIGGGGGQYNGTITVTRLGGGYTIVESAQTLTLSLVLGPDGQVTVRFDTPSGSGSIAGTLAGSLANGSFQSTMLLSTAAQQGSSTLTCEGRASVAGGVSGRNLTFTASSITYDNCPGLMARSEAEAIAISPIPGAPGGGSVGNVVVRILGGISVAAATCPGGTAGYPFMVEIAETSGIDFTFDGSFVVEERRGNAPVTSTTIDMPFTDLIGGTRRTYGVCRSEPGTYQAFFRGTDANGHVIRVASPLVTLGGLVGTSSLSGSVTNAATGGPIAGATVAVGALSTSTNAAGTYTLANLPSGTRGVQTSAPGFSPRADLVDIAASGTTAFSTSLVPIGAGGGGGISIVLNWAAEPEDLDAYLTGPTGGGGQFTVWYGNRNPVPHAALDVDDRSGFGPETITVSAPGGTFVAGTYEYLVNNFSGSTGFNASNATVTVFQGGAQLAQFAVSGASGTPSADNWLVFRFTLTATASGQIVITPIQQFVAEGPVLALKRPK
jgi:hypothetical protein